MVDEMNHLWVERSRNHEGLRSWMNLIYLFFPPPFGVTIPVANILLRGLSHHQSVTLRPVSQVGLSWEVCWFGHESGPQSYVSFKVYLCQTYCVKHISVKLISNLPLSNHWKYHMAIHGQYLGSLLRITIQWLNSFGVLLDWEGFIDRHHHGFVGDINSIMPRNHMEVGAIPFFVKIYLMNWNIWTHELRVVIAAMILTRWYIMSQPHQLSPAVWTQDLAVFAPGCALPWGQV